MFKELLSDHKKYLLPVLSAGLFGFIFGIYAKPNLDGVFIETPWIVVGVEQTPIPELRLDQLSSADIAVLEGKVEALGPETPLGEKFRELAVFTKGPFKRVKLDAVNIRLNRDRALGYQIAKVCDDSPLLNKILLAHKVVHPENIRPQGMISIRVQATEFCSDEDRMTGHNIWLDRDTLIEWIPHLETLPEFWTPDTLVSASAMSVVSGY